MSDWICCNLCFKPPGRERQLALTNCGHIICSVCFQKGKEDECLICKAKCQLSPLSDKSSSEVKALFSDIGTTAVKRFTEISKVLQFQSRHQKRLLAYYQQKHVKMKEAVIKMQEEMQQMSKKITEQKAYITKLELVLQQQSSRLVSQSNRDLHASNSFKPGHFSSPSVSLPSVTKIPYSSPVSLSRHVSTTSLENMEIENRSFPGKPSMSGSVPRLCVISPPQDGRIGTVPYRIAGQNAMGSHLVRGTPVSRGLSSSLKEPALTSPSIAPYRREAAWETPVFKVPPTFRYPSMSSLGPPP
ncbi:probable E3 SUMO-protein ligase RNF212 isoform X3 [Trichomycterus rosablanca]|uniref:probable E3 SUMO-protein ligase RNF212 isoform X3 n=1 Tax=Trichomycterus rosablanca TaxID=2290929 RepID=UPI002F358E6F